MDEFSTTSDNLDQNDEDILTYTVSDNALEAAADIEGGVLAFTVVTWCAPTKSMPSGCANALGRMEAHWESGVSVACDRRLRQAPDVAASTVLFRNRISCSFAHQGGRNPPDRRERGDVLSMAPGVRWAENRAGEAPEGP